MTNFIRIWKQVDIKDIEEHLLIVGSSTGNCSKCKKLGINYSTDTHCPECGTPFKYIASRTKEIKKIKEKRPDLIFIELEDYNKSINLKKAQKFFNT